MAVTLKYIAQASMDSYFQNYKGNADFFELDDFIFRAGAVITDYYQKMYQAKYGELKQDKRAAIDLVGFDSDMLSVQVLEVLKDKETQEYYSTLTDPIMTFMYDHSNVGYQMLLPLSPKNVNLERTALNELWQVQYLPFTDRIFWLPDNGKITYIKKGFCNIKSVSLYYIPALMNKDGEVLGEAQIADGLVDMAINATVMRMKGIAEGTVVKETNDGNSNKIMETEINKQALK